MYIHKAQLDRGLPHDASNVEAILLVGAVQILFLDVPDHAAVDLSVRLAQTDRHTSRYSSLINAVLRRLARHGQAPLGAIDGLPPDTPGRALARLDLPDRAV